MVSDEKYLSFHQLSKILLKRNTRNRRKLLYETIFWNQIHYRILQTRLRLNLVGSHFPLRELTTWAFPEFRHWLQTQFYQISDHRCLVSVNCYHFNQNCPFHFYFLANIQFLINFVGPFDNQASACYFMYINSFC